MLSNGNNGENCTADYWQNIFLFFTKSAVSKW